MSTAILGIAVLFFLGHGLNRFFLLTKVPDLLFLIAVGYLLGPVFHMIEPQDLGKSGGVLATIALIVILYEGGLNLKARELLTSSLPALGLALFGFLAVVTLALFFTTHLTQQSEMAGLLVGISISSTSSAIVLPLVRALSISERTKTVLALESAITDVLVIIVALLAIEVAAGGAFSPRALAIGLGPATLLALVLGAGAGMAWVGLARVAPSIVHRPFAGEAWALFVYGVVELFGLNGALGVLALGFSLGNLEFLPARFKELSDLKSLHPERLELLQEITFLLKTFFFVYLGLLLELGNYKVLSFAFLLTVAIFLLRYLAVRVLFAPRNYGRVDAMMATAMGPRGLACAVVAMIPAQRGLPEGPFVQSVTFAVICFSITATAVLVFLIEQPRFRNSLARPFLRFEERPPF